MEPRGRPYIEKYRLLTVRMRRSSSKTIIATDWREETMLLVAPANHALVGKSRVCPEDLASEALVAFAPNLRIRHEIDRYLRHLGITMQIAAELDNIDSVKHALEVHSAVAFLPEPTVQEEIESGAIVALNCPWLNLSRPLGLIQRRNSTLGRTARGVMELIQESVRAGEQVESSLPNERSKSLEQPVR